MTIAENLRAVRERIAEAARAAGRDPASIELVAVSKTKPAEAVREAYAAGQRAFGENYVQELVAKADELSGLEGIAWHMIGHLQSNKARLVAKVPGLALVHTVDSVGLAKELGKRAATRLEVLLEVNVGREPQKHGALPEGLAELVAAVRAEPMLALRGLMTVPPASEDLAATRAVFEELARLRDMHGGLALLPELSMGMTHDLEAAIAAGATRVRVGTAIFGGR